jgi:hypothetical protein
MIKGLKQNIIQYDIRYQQQSEKVTAETNNKFEGLFKGYD